MVTKKIIFLTVALTIATVASFLANNFVNSAPDSSCPALKNNDLVQLPDDAYMFQIEENNNNLNLVVSTNHIQRTWKEASDINPIIISQKCFDSLDFSDKVITHRPGSYIFKYSKSNQLYVALPGNKVAKISPDVATVLYGNATGYYSVVNLHAFYWLQYSAKAPDITQAVPHAGMLVSPDKRKTIYYVDENQVLHEVTPQGFTANHFQTGFVRLYIPKTTLANMRIGSKIDSVLPHLVDIYQLTTSSYPTDPTPTTTYQLSSSASSVNEGSSVTVTLATTNLANNTNVAYNITGLSANDLTSGSLTGNFIINNNQASVSLTLVNDQTTEGTENLVLALNNNVASTSITVNDTSLTPVTPPPSSYGTTYYIRTDGGDASQCDGKSDKALNSDKHCAWSHPFIALPPGGTVKIAGGDTLIINNGSYKMGIGAPGTAGLDKCNASWSYDCIMANIPSGPSKNKPTKILGADYANGCSVKPELWGSGRPWTIVDMNNSDNVELQCLEITDHSSCVESHSGSLACNRNTPPFGDWASMGIRSQDSENVLLKNLDVHGLAHTGIQAGRLTDWRIENTKIEANGWVGWDGDISGNDSNSGTMTFKRVDINWNGCGQTYPGRQPVGCWGQSAGGYGDGLGTGSTGGNWIFEDSNFLYNTSDGLDLIYHRENGKITIRRVHAEGNAGNQLKTSGNTEITDSLVIGNCAYFQGKSFTHNVDSCRALGNAVSISMTGVTSPILFYNNSVYGNGDGLLYADNSGVVKLRNNIFYAGVDYLQNFENSFYLYSEGGTTFDNDYNLVYQAKDNGNYCKQGSHNLCNVDPKLTSVSGNFNLKPLSDSPAIDRGITALTNIDYLSNTRPQSVGVDIGAYEIQI